MNHFAVYDVVQFLEMRDVKGSHGLDRARQCLPNCLTRVRPLTALAEVASQEPENPRTVETLSFAMVAKTHRVSMCDHPAPGA